MESLQRKQDEKKAEKERKAVVKMMQSDEVAAQVGSVADDVSLILPLGINSVEGLFTGQCCCRSSRGHRMALIRS